MAKENLELKHLSDITAQFHEDQISTMKQSDALTLGIAETQGVENRSRKEAIENVTATLRGNGVIAKSSVENAKNNHQEQLGLFDKSNLSIESANDNAKKAALGFNKIQLSLLGQIKSGLNNGFGSLINEGKKRAQLSSKYMKDRLALSKKSALKKLEAAKDKLTSLPGKGFKKVTDNIKKGVSTIWGFIKKVLKGALLIALMVGLGKFLESETFKKILADLESGVFFDNLMNFWDKTKEKITGFIDGVDGFIETLSLVVAGLVAFKLGKGAMGLLGGKDGTKGGAVAKGTTKVKGKGKLVGRDAKTGKFTKAKIGKVGKFAKLGKLAKGAKVVGKFVPGPVKAVLAAMLLIPTLLDKQKSTAEKVVETTKVGVGLAAAGVGAMAGAKLGGLIGTFFGPGIGTAIGAGLGGLVGGGLGYFMGEKGVDILTKPFMDKTKKLTDAQREANKADKENGSTVIVNAPANSNTTNNQTSQVMENSMPEVARPNNFGEPAFA
jgi:hypothetical protein